MCFYPITTYSIIDKKENFQVLKKNAEEIKKFVKSKV